MFLLSLGNVEESAMEEVIPMASSAPPRSSPLHRDPLSSRSTINPSHLASLVGGQLDGPVAADSVLGAAKTRWWWWW